MPTHCTWVDAEQSILMMQFMGDWTWEDYRHVTEEARLLAETQPYRVDYISDLRAGTQPRTGSPLANGKSALRQRAANSGIIVVLGGLFETSMLNVFKQIDRESRHIMFSAKSLEDALAVIARERAKAS